MATKTQTVLGVLEKGLQALAVVAAPTAADPVIAAIGVAAQALIDMMGGTIPPLDAAAIIQSALGDFGPDDTEVDGEARLALGVPVAVTVDAAKLPPKP